MKCGRLWPRNSSKYLVRLRAAREGDEHARVVLLLRLELPQQRGRASRSSPLRVHLDHCEAREREGLGSGRKREAGAREANERRTRSARGTDVRRPAGRPAAHFSGPARRAYPSGTSPPRPSRAPRIGARCSSSRASYALCTTSAIVRCRGGRADASCSKTGGTSSPPTRKSIECWQRDLNETRLFHPPRAAVKIRDAFRSSPRPPRRVHRWQELRTAPRRSPSPLSSLRASATTTGAFATDPSRPRAPPSGAGVLVTAPSTPAWVAPPAPARPSAFSASLTPSMRIIRSSTSGERSRSKYVIGPARARRLGRWSRSDPARRRPARGGSLAAAPIFAASAPGTAAFRSARPRASSAVGRARPSAPFARAAPRSARASALRASSGARASRDARGDGRRASSRCAWSASSSPRRPPLPPPADAAEGSSAA